MNKKSFCQACHNISQGIKTRVSVDHTCGKELNQITPQQLKCANTLVSQLGIDKEAKGVMIMGFTGGRSDSSKELTYNEAAAFIKHLKGLDPNKAGAEKMRNKILYYAHEMGWHIKGTTKIDMQRVDNWCLTKGYIKRKLDNYSYEELPKLVSQFEAVYKYFLKGF